MLRMDKRGDGQQSIANALNGAGIRNRSGREWSRQLIHKLIVSYDGRQEALEQR